MTTETVGNVRLPHGLMPRLGIGTRRSEPGQVKRALTVAIEVRERVYILARTSADSYKAGVRHIDCAWVYGTEPEVGEAVAEAIAAGIVTREELFIVSRLLLQALANSKTSKLWNHFHEPARVRTAFDESLKALNLRYLDLYLMHWPVAFQYQGHRVRTPLNPDGSVAVDFLRTKNNSETWHEMEKLVDLGLVRDIGVSNFCEARMDKLIKSAKIKPAVNQVELHPYYPQNQLIEYSKKNNIHLTAFSPLGSWLSKLPEDPVVLAIAREYNSEPGSILIAWGLSRGTSLIPKSVNVKRVVANFNARTISLRQDSIDKLNALDRGQTFGDPSETWGLDIYCRKQETVDALYL